MHIPNNSICASLSLANLDLKSQDKLSDTISDKLNYTSNSSSTFNRTLNIYGIDNNQKALREACKTDTPTILAHRDLEGRYKLETGLYISDPKSGDAYGDFKFYQGRGTKKYQTPHVARLEFDKNSLQKLKDTYHNVLGPTAFLSELLALRPGKDLDIYQSTPTLFSFLPSQDKNSNGFLIFPNLPYIETPSLLNAPTTMKDNKEGIAICAYAIHPNQDTSLTRHMNRGKHPDITDITTVPLKDTRTANEIESGSTVKYLSSILDLDFKDIPMLERLGKYVLEHLTEAYSIDTQKDKVQLFFHFPVAEVTATLHLHARVNKADHPLNEARSFALTEVIDVLKSGGSTIEMILARNNGVYHIGADESVAKIQHIPNKGTVENPHTLTLSQPFEKAFTPEKTI